MGSYALLIVQQAFVCQQCVAMGCMQVYAVMDEQHHIGEVLDVFVSMPMMCSYICIMPTCMSPCGCVLLFCSLSPPLSHLLLCMSVCLCLILSASISHCHTLVLSVLFSLSLSGCLLILCACLPFVCLSLIIVKSFVGFFNFSQLTSIKRPS